MGGVSAGGNEAKMNLYVAWRGVHRIAWHAACWIEPAMVSMQWCGLGVGELCKGCTRASSHLVPHVKHGIRQCAVRSSAYGEGMRGAMHE